MRKGIMLFGFITSLFGSKAQVPDFDKYPVYDKTDLGVTYSKTESTFRVWAPVAEAAELLIYDSGAGGKKVKHVSMNESEGGTWVTTQPGDMHGSFYNYRVKINGKWMDEVTDPYTKSAGVNGRRGVVVDLSKTNPDGWSKDKRPADLHPTASIIYELHVRDATISPSSGVRNKGKFLGLTERGTRNSTEQSTGLDHISSLGVTHVHLLPVYDFNSVDESSNSPRYNWGYDPLNYNVPEGSYSTNAYDPVVRIKEFKQLVKSFHDNGLRVVMDVVYNHTALTEKSNFNQLVPGYYYRQTADGKFSNATACGNETASERPMFRKFMLESMKYWVEEYHIDGFRVDLMGVHDIETMNIISRELNRIHPGILIYGEGWTAGASPLPESMRAVKANAAKLDRIAVFSDDIRDGLKGSVFEHQDRGFVSNKPGMEESVKFGIVAAGTHPDINYSKVNYSKAPYTMQPSQVVNYAECHDNHVLRDKLELSATAATDGERRDMYHLALATVLTSQGIVFLHAGTELYRTKKGVENSFESPDSINAINWDWKTSNSFLTDFVRELIKLRKEHPAFRMHTAEEIRQNLHFLKDLPAGMIGYTINGEATGDSWKSVMVLLNGTDKPQSVSVAGKPKIKCAIKGKPNPELNDVNEITVRPYSFFICHD